MKHFKITVKQDGIHGNQEFTGNFSYETQEDAEQEAKEWYASELGVTPDDIEIIRTEEFNPFEMEDAI